MHILTSERVSERTNDQGSVRVRGLGDPWFNGDFGYKVHYKYYLPG